MSVDLIYKHQQKTYELMKQELAQGNRVAYVFPVGCGKSFPVLKYIEENPDKKVLFVSPNLGIIYQFKEYLSQYVSNGKQITEKEFPNFRAISYQKVTLATGNCELHPDVIIFDEIHRIGAEHWEQAVDELINDFPNAEIIGMSATPERTDKRNMAYEKFDSIVYEMSLTEALSGEKEDEVVLKGGARYERVLSQLVPEIESYKEQIELIENEEIKQRAIKIYQKLEAIVSESPDIQEIMAQGMKKKNGKYLVFCASREEMYEKMAQAQEIFGKVNSKINVDYVISKYEGQGKTKAENRKTLQEFEKREEDDSLNLLFCVDMLNEGVHLKGISGEVMFRPTESPIIYKQQIGRVLSADKEAEETVIIDAVNNWLRQKETFIELQGAIERGNEKDGKKDNEKKRRNLFGLEAEEIELLNLLQDIGEIFRYNNKETYKKIVEWLETHEGKMPRGTISKEGKVVSRKEMTDEEREERNLYARWVYAPEYKALKECQGIPIDVLPLEYQKYKEQIEILRGYGLGISAFEQIVNWLETHNGTMPRSTIRKEGKVVYSKEMTEEEREETNLYDRWKRSSECKALKKCQGIPIDELPPEYQEYKDQIRTLRSLMSKTTFEQIVNWLETHNGKMPRSTITKEMTEEEKREENNLYQRWIRTPEYKALKKCQGIPIDELPPEYQEYKDQIRTLRSLISKTTFEQIVNWLETHNGKMPRSASKKEGKVVSRKEMTEEEREEANLYVRWIRTPEYKALKACQGIPIEELPIEYQEYKEQIEVLRKYEQIDKDNKLKRKMQRSVGKQVKNNNITRQELQEAVIELEASTQKGASLDGK